MIKRLDDAAGEVISGKLVTLPIQWRSVCFSAFIPKTGRGAGCLDEQPVSTVLADWTTIIRSPPRCSIFPIRSMKTVLWRGSKYLGHGDDFDYVDTHLSCERWITSCRSWNRYLKICQRDRLAPAGGDLLIGNRTGIAGDLRRKPACARPDDAD